MFLSSRYHEVIREHEMYWHISTSTSGLDGSSVTLGIFSETLSSSIECGGWKTGLLGPLPALVLHYSISLKLLSNSFCFISFQGEEVWGLALCPDLVNVYSVIWKISLVLFASEVCHNNGWKSTLETAVYYIKAHCWIFQCGKCNKVGGKHQDLETLLECSILKLESMGRRKWT